MYRPHNLSQSRQGAKERQNPTTDSPARPSRNRRMEQTFTRKKDKDKKKDK